MVQKLRKSTPFPFYENHELKIQASTCDKIIAPEISAKHERFSEPQITDYHCRMVQCCETLLFPQQVGALAGQSTESFNALTGKGLSAVQKRYAVAIACLENKNNRVNSW